MADKNFVFITAQIVSSVMLQKALALIAPSTTVAAPMPWNSNQIAGIDYSGKQQWLYPHVVDLRDEQFIAHADKVLGGFNITADTTVLVDSDMPFHEYLVGRIRPTGATIIREL